LTWLVATSEIGRQTLALDNLTNQGFVSYRPLYREKFFVRGRKCWRTASLFGRYFFVFASQHWPAIRYTRGVDSLLAVEERPLGVADQEVEAIRAREGRDGLIHIIKGFQPGQRVRVKRGILIGALGTFVTLIGQDREVALFELLGQLTRVELAAGTLAAVA
jgi:transcription antitermination factor NusG